MFYIAITFIPLMLLFGYLMGSWAKNKGYEFWNWFFASSILGFIWLALSRNAHLEEMSDDVRKEVIRKGNKTGSFLSFISILFTFMTIMNLLFSMSYNY